MTSYQQTTEIKGVTCEQPNWFGVEVIRACTDGKQTVLVATDGASMAVVPTIAKPAPSKPGFVAFSRDAAHENVGTIDPKTDATTGAEIELINDFPAYLPKLAKQLEATALDVESRDDRDVTQIRLDAELLFKLARALCVDERPVVTITIGDPHEPFIVEAEDGGVGLMMPRGKDGATIERTTERVRQAARLIRASYSKPNE